MNDRVRASCHCGAVVIEADLPEGLASARRCNCSFCRRRGAAAVTALTDTLRVVQGEDALTLYQWGTRTARHHFCRYCGIYVYHQRRSDPAECGVNMGCIEGVDPSEHEPIPWQTDGASWPLDEP